MAFRFLLVAVVATAALTAATASAQDELLVVSAIDEQNAKEEQRLKCENDLLFFQSQLEHFADQNITLCPPDFDGRACWQETYAGHEVTVGCPQYINGFINDTEGTSMYSFFFISNSFLDLKPLDTVMRRCTADGEWEWLPDHDYTYCGEALLEWKKVIKWLVINFVYFH